MKTYYFVKTVRSEGTYTNTFDSLEDAILNYLWTKTWFNGEITLTETENILGHNPTVEYVIAA